MAKDVPPRPAKRAYPPDTEVIAQGFKRAFPLAADDPFQKLILAIDAADSVKK